MAFLMKHGAFPTDGEAPSCIPMAVRAKKVHRRSKKKCGYDSESSSEHDLSSSTLESGTDIRKHNLAEIYPANSGFKKVLSCEKNRLDNRNMSERSKGKHRVASMVKRFNTIMANRRFDGADPL